MSDEKEEKNEPAKSSSTGSPDASDEASREDEVVEFEFNEDGEEDLKKTLKKLREDLEKLSTEELVTRLQARDPARASAIDSHNRVRLIRALEIVESIGKVPPQTAPQLLYATKI